MANLNSVELVLRDHICSVKTTQHNTTQTKKNNLNQIIMKLFTTIKNLILLSVLTTASLSQSVYAQISASAQTSASAHTSAGTILEVSPNSLNGAYSFSPGAFLVNDIISPSCEEYELSFLGVEIDSNSSSGELILGLYAGGALIYQTDQVLVPENQNVLVGEALSSSIVLVPGVDYSIGVMYASSSDIFFKTTQNPVHLGHTAFTSTNSYLNTGTTYPMVPDPLVTNELLDFNLGFHIEGQVNSYNTSGLLSISACEQYTSPSGLHTWTTSGTYFDAIPNSVGCDSSLIIYLTIEQPVETNESMLACDSYYWATNGQTYTSSGVYSAALVGSNGCDSIVNLDLTITYSTSSVIIVETCDSYFWNENGQTYTASGIYVETLMNSTECDSSVILDLTINHSTSDTIYQEACESYFWALNDMTYYTSGIYTHTTLSPTECNVSTVLVLTVNNGFTVYEAETSCGNFTWPLTGATYTTSGLYTGYLPNANGCDTVVSLHLTIVEPVYQTDVITTCASSYTWIDGITYTASNNQATMTYQTVNGCDSVVTLNLFFMSTQYATESIVACGSYTWVDGVTYTSSTSTPVDTIISAGGCEFITNLNLTILESTNHNDVISACGSYTWIDGNTYSTSNNTATFTMSNSAGCDSLITLELTIEEINTTVSVNDVMLMSNDSNASYQWYKETSGLQEIQGANGQTYVAQEDGVYAVEVIKGSCSEMSQLVVVSTNALNSLESDYITLYPNPSNGQFQIEFNGDVKELNVFDLTGRLMSIDYSSENKMVNTHNLTAGKYIVQIITENDKVLRDEIIIM